MGRICAEGPWLFPGRSLRAGRGPAVELPGCGLVTPPNSLCVTTHTQPQVGAVARAGGQQPWSAEDNSSVGVWGWGSGGRKGGQGPDTRPGLNK